MKYQRGISLSSLMFWGVVLALVAILGMKVAPATIEYYKILKATKSTLEQVSKEATVAEVRGRFSKFMEIDHVGFSADQLEISKENGQIVISFAYEKRIPLFYNVSLLIDYQGSTAN
jgi:hypothetical protein